MTNKEPKILIFTENFQKRFLAEGIDEVKNLQSFLDTHPRKDWINLVGVKRWYRHNGVYEQNEHEANFKVINTNEIDFVYGPENLIYSESSLTTRRKFSVLWEMKGLEHTLIGDIEIPGKDIRKFNINDTKQEKKQKEKELIRVLNKQLNKNFTSLYDIRADTPYAKKEFKDLFKETGVKMSEINKILVNNKRKSNSATSMEVYLGENSNKNYK